MIYVCETFGPTISMERESLRVLAVDCDFCCWVSWGYGMWQNWQMLFLCQRQEYST